MDKAQLISDEQKKSIKYIEEHSLNDLIGKMLDSLIRSKSNNPEQFMITYLQNKIKEDEEKKKNNIQTKKKKEKVTDNSPINIDEKSNSAVKKFLNETLLKELRDVKLASGVTLKRMVKLAENDPNNKSGILILDNEVLYY